MSESEDPTTIGYAAEPEVIAAEVEALRGDLAGVLAESDPLVRYAELTAEQARLTAIHNAEVAELKHLRGLALRELMASCGYTQAQAGEVTGLGTQQRVSKVLAAVREEDQ